MLGYLIVLLLLLPFIDLYLLIELSSAIGFAPTLGIILLTGFAGAIVVKKEGRNLLGKLQRSVTAKEVSRNLLEGVLLALGGLLLMSPGLVTDLIGFLMVLRPSRERIMLRLVSKLEGSGEFEVRTYSF